MAAPVITGLLGVNAYNPSETYGVSFDGTWIYATRDDYWLQVTGTHLDTVTSVAFTKPGQADRPAAFHVLSSTLLEVKTPYTVLARSRVTVRNPDGEATSSRGVTPIFAGEWQTPDAVTFDTDGISDWTSFVNVSLARYGSRGAEEYGTYGTPYDRPPLTSYADLIDTEPTLLGEGSIDNTITNDLTAAGYSPDPTAEQDGVFWEVAQQAVNVDLHQLFYNRLADLGVPGYGDGDLLPAGAVQAIPDGTDLETAFFDSRITDLSITVSASQYLTSRYSSVASRGDGTNSWTYFDTSALQIESVDDTIEVRNRPGWSYSFQSTSELNSAELLASIDFPGVPALRVPDDEEEEPTAPYFLDPGSLQTGEITDPSALDSSRLHYTLVFTSYRTYTAPADPGIPTLVTLPVEYAGGFQLQALARVRGSSAFVDPNIHSANSHVRRVALTWTPPRYRFFVTTPEPLGASPPLRQVGRPDASRHYPRTAHDGTRQVGQIP